MTRALSSTDKTEVTSTRVGIVEFLSLALPSGTIYLTSGDRPYTVGGNTYQPSGGQWGSIGNYNETADSVPRPMQIQLSGVDATLIANIVGNDIQWVAMTYSIGLTDETGELLDAPSFSAPAFIGDCTISLTDGGGIIAISGENLLADLQNRNSGCLQTDADQRARFSGDSFFQEIASVINKVIYWGQYGPVVMGSMGGAAPPPGGPGGGNKTLPV